MEKADKYFRLVYGLLEYCTRMARSLVMFYLKENKPEGFKEEDWTIDAFLIQQLKKQKMPKLDYHQMNILIPEMGNTDINAWDISLLIFVLDLFEKGPAIRDQIFFIKKMRNSLFHATSIQITDDKYQNYKAKILRFSETVSKVLNDQSFKQDIETCFNELEKEDEVDEETQTKSISDLENWIKNDPFFECIDRIPAETKLIMEELFQTIKQFLNNFEYKVPDVSIGVKICGCNSEISKEVSKQLLHYMCQNSSSEEKVSPLGKAISGAKDALLDKSRTIIETRQGCLIIRLRCDDIEGLWYLLSDCITGQMSVKWQGVQSCLRAKNSAPDLTVDVGISTLEFLHCMKELAWNVFDAISQRRITNIHHHPNFFDGSFDTISAQHVFPPSNRNANYAAMCGDRSKVQSSDYTRLQIDAVTKYKYEFNIMTRSINWQSF